MWYTSVSTFFIAQLVHQACSFSISLSVLNQRHLPIILLVLWRICHWLLLAFWNASLLWCPWCLPLLASLSICPLLWSSSKHIFLLPCALHVGSPRFQGWPSHSVFSMDLTSFNPAFHDDSDISLDLLSWTSISRCLLDILHMDTSGVSKTEVSKTDCWSTQELPIV